MFLPPLFLLISFTVQEKSPGLENRASSPDEVILASWHGSLCFLNCLTFTLAATKESLAHPEGRKYTEGRDDNIDGKYAIWGKINLEPSCTAYTKINSRWIKEMIIIIIIMEQNVGEKY